MMQDIRASIDIGSNSVLLLIGEMKNGKLLVHSKRSEVTALGRELDKNKSFHPESMRDTFEALKSYAEDCDKFGISRSSIIVTATEAARVAHNAPDFFSEIQKDLGIKVNIITSQAEAYFSAKGILFDTKFESEVITIMDIGRLHRINQGQHQEFPGDGVDQYAYRSSPLHAVANRSALCPKSSKGLFGLQGRHR